MKLRSDSFANDALIPPAYAFGKIGDPVALSDNRSPHLAWSGAPAATRSFVLMCIDIDVPSKPDDVNQTDREIPADLLRAEFVHWLMIDIRAEVGEFGVGACSDGVTARGKQHPPGPPGSRQGANDYTSWFAGDDDMRGTYLGYDGPCPPWNDSIVHRYEFHLFALDLPTLDVPDAFTLADVRAAMRGHVLAQATWAGRYSLNPRLSA